MAELNLSETVRTRALEAKSAQEVLNVLAEEGVELPDELLEGVAGGTKSPMRIDISGNIGKFFGQAADFDPASFLTALSDCVSSLPAGLASLQSSVASIPGLVATVSGSISEE